MISSVREQFNAAFSQEKYQELLKSIEKDFGFLPAFRIAETPFFISETLKSQLLEACEELIYFLKRSDFKQITQRALDLNTEVPNEDAHSQFLAIDFGICEENGLLIPKLIEVQGFPTVFNFQFNLFQKLISVYPFLSNFTPYLSGFDEKKYLEMLRKTVLGKFRPEEVVLLEIEPENQNTKIDFYYCRRDLGIPVCCVTEIEKEGRKLFYRDSSGNKIQIKRIYNRVIFDELNSRPDLKMNFSFLDDLDVEWAGHPNWYTRVSKFILPYLDSPYFIDTTLMSELKEIPQDLENYVLKSLFSFSGAGVVFNVKPSDIENLKHPDQFILQKKVTYAPVIEAPNGKVKVEVRIFALWPEEDESPTLVGNLARLSRGEMIGVKYNKDKDWVGASIGLFEK